MQTIDDGKKIIGNLKDREQFFSCCKEIETMMFEQYKCYKRDNQINKERRNHMKWTQDFSVEKHLQQREEIPRTDVSH
jgi:hypothetical protein